MKTERMKDGGFMMGKISILALLLMFSFMGLAQAQEVTYPNAESMDYVARNEVKSETVESFNNVSRNTRSVNISGKTLVFQKGFTLYDAYNNNEDIKQFSLFAETVIIRSPLNLPQTNVTIRARELRFEDVGVEKAFINTTPGSLTIRPAQSANGSHGLTAGNVTLHLEKFYADGDDKRFILNGGNGQTGGLGANGANGTTMAPVPTPGTTINGVNYTVVWCHNKEQQDCICIGVIIGDGWNTWEDGTPNKWPGDGKDAVPGGKPGNGGNGGNFFSNMNDMARYISQNYGTAGSKAPDYTGGAAGEPVYSAWKSWKKACCKDAETSITDTHISKKGNDAASPSADIPVGKAGTISSVGSTITWFTPFALKAILAHAKDVYLQALLNEIEGQLDEVGEILKDYLRQVEAYNLSAEWANLSDTEQHEFLQLKGEMEILLRRIDTPEPASSCEEFQLTRTANNGGAAWSSDGSKLVFIKWDDRTQNLWTIHSDGSDEKVLTSYSNNRGGWYIGVWGAAFRPNTSQIYYMEDSRGTLHWIRWASEDGNSWDNGVGYVPGGDGFSPPSFSEDGSQRCYIHYSYNESRVRGAKREIKVANTDGSNVRIILRDDDMTGNALWGKGTSNNKIAYSKTISGVSCIFTIDTDGSNVTRITEPSLGNCDVTDFVSDKIFFTNNNQVSYVNVQTKKITRITDDAYENSQAVLSPDGKKIAYTSKRDGVYHIYITCDQVVDQPKDESGFTAGVFKVGETGVVQTDWLYDGGMYKGELGIFSLKDMDTLTPGSTEFIAEAVRRVLSDSTEGHIVLSDPAEGARFSGSLGEPTNWNSGEYKGVKSFEMIPGDSFVTILVPDSTFTALAANPGTADSHKRPLFSLVSPNPAYGMYLGQIADVNGMGTAFSYEDMSADTSDRDYNDLIIQVFGAAVQDIPSMDSLKGKTARSKRDSSDWRTGTELGRIIMAHLDAQTVSPETVWLSADVNFPADITVYSPDETAFGTKGGHIPGATFGTDIDGYVFVKLPSIENGGYRIVLLSAEEQSGLLTLRKHQGDEILSETGGTVTLEAHGTVKAEVSVSDSGDESGVEIGITEEGIRYDFNGDGVIDDVDIESVTEPWNTCEGDEKFDPFFDLDDDGCITVKDIMKVAGGNRQ